MRRRTVAAFVIAVVLAGSAAHAQDAETSVSPLAEGVQSLAFGIGGGGTGSFGYWRMRSDRLNVGWEIDLNASQRWASAETPSGSAQETSTTSVAVSVGPRFRRYMETQRSVVPFAETGISAGYRTTRSSTEVNGTDNSQTSHVGTLRASLGIGVEWFPVTRVSVSGHTGASGVVGYARSQGGAQDTWELGLGTFTTALSFRIYLPQGSTLR